MADYYPLLAKAVAGLPDATAEARHAVYERARKALFGQLRNLDPPVPEEVIEREAQALERAVAQLETDLAGPEAQAAPVPANELAPAPPPQPGSPEPDACSASKAGGPGGASDTSAAASQNPPRSGRGEPRRKARRDAADRPPSKARGGSAGSEGARLAGRAAGFGGRHGFYRPNRLRPDPTFLPSPHPCPARKTLF